MIKRFKYFWKMWWKGMFGKIPEFKDPTSHEEIPEIEPLPVDDFSEYHKRIMENIENVIKNANRFNGIQKREWFDEYGNHHLSYSNTTWDPNAFDWSDRYLTGEPAKQLEPSINDKKVLKRILEDSLQDALEIEDYEKATTIRDQLKEL